MDIQTDKQIDRVTKRQTDRETDNRQRYLGANRMIDRQTEMQTVFLSVCLYFSLSDFKSV